MSDLSTDVTVIAPDTLAVKVTGEIDMITVPELIKALRAAIVEHRPQRVELDLTGVPFMDSTGIQVLVAADTDMQGMLRITDASPPVRRVLGLTGLLATFGLTDTAGNPT